MAKAKYVVTPDGREYKVKSRDGKYIYCADGVQFRIMNPYIKVIEKELPKSTKVQKISEDKKIVRNIIEETEE